MGKLVIESSADRRPLNVIGDAITPLLTANHGTSFELFDLTGPAGSGPPPHCHPWDEAYYILDGEVLLVADGNEQTVRAGDVVQIPGGMLHLYNILSPSARFLVITSPEGAAKFFSDVDEQVGAMPESLPTLVEVAQRNGLQSPLFDAAG